MTTFFMFCIYTYVSGGSFCRFKSLWNIRAEVIACLINWPYHLKRLYHHYFAYFLAAFFMFFLQYMCGACFCREKYLWNIWTEVITCLINWLYHLKRPYHVYLCIYSSCFFVTTFGMHVVIYLCVGKFCEVVFAG